MESNGATVIPMKQRPEGVTVKGWLQEQIDEVRCKLDWTNEELQKAASVVDMRDGEYEDAKKAAKEFVRENPDTDCTAVDNEEDAAYGRLAEANREHEDLRLAARRLQHQFDWMSEKIKFMPAGF